MRLALLFMLTLAMGISGCSSQKKLVTEAPFEVVKPSSTVFAGGREETGMGIMIEIPLILNNVDEISFNEIFYRGHSMDPDTDIRDGMAIVSGRHQNHPVKPDINMNADPYKEAGNQPPSLKKKKDYPFTLEKDEAVVSYTLKGKDEVFYYKITGIKEKPPRIYPSKPKQ